MYEANTYDIIFPLERKFIDHFTLWKVFSTALKLYNGTNTVIQIITVRQPTMKAVRSTRAKKKMWMVPGQWKWKKLLISTLCLVQTRKVPMYKTNSHPLYPGFPSPALHHRNSRLWTFPSSLTFVSPIQQFLPGSSSLFTPCELILLAAALTQAAMVFFPLTNMWFIHHCLRTVNGTEFACLSRHKDLSSTCMAKLCRATQSFPSQISFPRTHSRRTRASVPQRDKTDLSSLKGSRDVCFYSLAQIPGWSQQMT